MWVNPPKNTRTKRPTIHFVWRCTNSRSSRKLAKSQDINHHTLGIVGSFVPLCGSSQFLCVEKYTCVPLFPVMYYSSRIMGQTIPLKMYEFARSVVHSNILANSTIRTYNYWMSYHLSALLHFPIPRTYIGVRRILQISWPMAWR